MALGFRACVVEYALFPLSGVLRLVQNELTIHKGGPFGVLGYIGDHSNSFTLVGPKTLQDPSTKTCIKDLHMGHQMLRQFCWGPDPVSRC